MSVASVASAVATLPTSSSLASPSLAPGQVDTDDAVLIELGRLLDSSWKEEDEIDASYQRSGKPEALGIAWDAAFQRTGAIADRILAVPARTIAGLQVKARAIAWCHRGEAEIVLMEDQRPTNILLAESIICDLLAM